jgi:hypothetical protein
MKAFVRPDLPGCRKDMGDFPSAIFLNQYVRARLAASNWLPVENPRIGEYAAQEYNILCQLDQLFSFELHVIQFRKMLEMRRERIKDCLA